MATYSKGSLPRDTFAAFLLRFAATQTRRLLPGTVHGARKIVARINVNIIWHIGGNATSIL
jgi:hypothetical protein